jgi:hypothetical protein
MKCEADIVTLAQNKLKESENHVMDTKAFIEKLNSLFCENNRKDKRYSQVCSRRFISVDCIRMECLR